MIDPDHKLQDAIQEFQDAFYEAVEPLVMPAIIWLDRVLKRLGVKP